VDTVRPTHSLASDEQVQALPQGMGALASARTELLLALATLLFALGVLAALPGSGFHLMVLLLIGAFFQSSNKYLAAPVLALLAEWDVRSRQANASASSEPSLAEPISAHHVDVVEEGDGLDIL